MAGLLNRRGTFYAQFFSSAREPSRKQFSLKTKDRAEARRRLARLENAYRSGEFDPWNDDPWAFDKNTASRSIRLDEARNQFLESRRKRDCAPETLRTYKDYLRRFKKDVGNVWISQISSGQIDDWCRESHLSQASKRSRYRHIRALFNWLAKEELISENPFDRLTTPKAGKKLPKVVTPRELRLISCAIFEDYRRKLPTGYINPGERIWRVPAFWMSMYAGLRASELGRLRWEHIDIENSLIYVFDQKSGSESTIPLISKARATLSTVSGPRTGYVFAAPRDERDERTHDFLMNWRDRMSHAFREGRKKAGIERQISLHGLRHGYCSILAKAGFSAPQIASAARHSDIRTSMRYVHLDSSELTQKMNEAFS